MKKLLVILGPTATGKTSLAVKLAKKFNGEIISADSRQVYQGMDIVTGKDKEKYDDIPVWGIDVVGPDKEFSAAHWLKLAGEKMRKIWSKGKLVIVVGGTGFWIKNLLQPPASLGIVPDFKLRRQLAKLSLTQLQEMLRKKDQSRFAKMNQSDKNNPRRLIRAIEIAKQSQNNKTFQPTKDLKVKDCLIVGLKADYKFLYQRIDQRVDQRVRQGAFTETKKLLQKGYNLSLASMSGLGYKELLAFLKAEKTKKEAIQSWKYSEHAYARRQMTFFKKMKGIKWFDISQLQWQKNVVKLIKTWYSNYNAGKN